MIVSWNWLTDYLKLDMPVEALGERLALSGLNFESVSDVGGDLAIDLEVTSNRPDCLGHLGVAARLPSFTTGRFRFPIRVRRLRDRRSRVLLRSRYGTKRFARDSRHASSRVQRLARAHGGCGSGSRRLASGRSAILST